MNYIINRDIADYNMAESFREEFDLQLLQLKRFTKHGPTLGRYVELLLLKLLRKYCPSSLDFTTGFVHSGNPSLISNTSSQIDIICYDRFNYPIVFDSSEFKVITARASKLFIEVKSNLTRAALVKGLNFLEKDILKEVPLNSQFYFVATSSSITAKAVFDILQKYYKQQSKAFRFLGGVYSLDWDEMIHCDLRNSESNKYTYSCLTLNNSNGIAPFISTILLNAFDENAYDSVVNLLSPSIYVPLDSFEFSFVLGR